MINDGGAERMVRNRKVTWYQILAVVIMTIIMLVFFVFIYFTFNADKLVGIIDKTTLKDEYNLLKEVRESFEDVAVYGYEQKDDTVKIEFRYYEEVLDKKTDLLELSESVREFITDYLNAHPEDSICKNKKKLDLRFPDIHYSNFSTDGEFEYSNELMYISYEHSDSNASDIVAKAGKLCFAREFSFLGEAGMDLSAKTDFSPIFKLSGLERIVIPKEALDSETLEGLRSACEQNNVELKVN